MNSTAATRLALIDGGEVCFRISAGSQIVRYRFYIYKEKADGWIKEFRYAADADKWLKEIGHVPWDPWLERHKFVARGTIRRALLNANNMINAIVKGTKADKLLLCFGHPTHNFRNDLATIKGYKSNRASRPQLYDEVKENLMKVYPFYEAEGWLEDDDVMASFQEQIRCQSSNVTPIICTQDKDLLQVPGWHFNTRSRELFEVSVVQGLRSFYKQLISGDPTDTIPGLYQITGKRNSKKFSKHIDEILLKPEDDIKAWNYVMDLYAEGFDSGRSNLPTTLTEVGNLLYMKRNWRDRWLPPTQRSPRAQIAKGPATQTN